MAIADALPLLFSTFLSALGGIVYELLIGGISSYLLGNSVYQFSITIGLFMSSMGLGSYLSRFVRGGLVGRFIYVEAWLGLVGGFSALALFAAYAYTDFYDLVMYLLIVAIGTLIGLEIPLLTRIIEDRHRNLRVTLANVLSFDYIGSLIGAVAFPLLFLPRVGLIRTAFLMGLVNLAVVALILIRYRREIQDEAAGSVKAGPGEEKAGLKGRARLYLATGLVLLIVMALSAGFAQSYDLGRYLEQHLYRDRVVYVEQSPYQKIVLTRNGDDLRLFLDGNLQFSSRDEYRYHEALVHPAMSLAPNHDEVLLLGAGDGLAAREILKYPDVGRITLVDLDARVVELARKNPAIRKLNLGALDDRKVRVVIQDAYKFLEQNSDLFAAIIIDLPDPNNESLNKLYTAQFYELAGRHLVPGGVMVTQSTSPYFAPQPFWSIVKTVKSAGLSAVGYHVNVPSFGDWGFTLASNRRLRLDKLHVIAPTRFLDDQGLRAAFTFGKDEVARGRGVQANTLTGDSQPYLV
ncbi:MAG: polyamine aminopropyltransferase [Firmicutes bacterium]|nr:polyamine aminopropyltransferase [Bacillota bacterium]